MSGFSGPPIGQAPGTATNDSANAGDVGEIISCIATGAAGTFTITIAAPGVATQAAHGLSTGAAVTPSTTGALPTGLVAGTTYYAIVVDANTYKLATTVANAIAGTAITTTGSQSGTHTATSTVSLSNGASADFGGIALTPGDWEVYATVYYVTAVGTSLSVTWGSISTTSATLDANAPNFDKALEVANIPGAASVSRTRKAGPVRKSLAATTNIFGVANSSFTLGTMTAYGEIRARRVR